VKEIEVALKESPSKIVLIVMRGHHDNKSGGVHAGDLENLPDGRKGWDHAAIAFQDSNGNPVYVEKTPGTGASIVMSANKSGTVQDVTKYRDVEIISLDLTSLPPGARERFITTFVEAVIQPYSLVLKNLGNHCSGAFGAALAAAKSPAHLWAQKLLNVLTMGLRFNFYSPTKAYMDGRKYAVPFRFDPKSPTQGNSVKHDWKYLNFSGRAQTTTPVSNSVNADGNGELLAGIALGAIVASSPEARASQQPRVDDDQKPLQQELQDPSDDEDDEDDEDALTDVSLQDPQTHEDDDEEDLEEEVRLASDSQDARPGDAPQQPEIDDDDDDEDVPTDDRAEQPAIDDDDEEQADDEKEELEDASDAQDAPTADALLETAKVEAGADATADDQPGHQLATSVPVTADDGFSFSLFPKPGVPTEVAKEVLPAEQTSPVEESSGSGLPGSESAHPDLESANVGNAAPAHERVLHHGDLAP
jgi:hypothetical protein